MYRNSSVSTAKPCSCNRIANKFALGSVCGGFFERCRYFTRPVFDPLLPRLLFLGHTILYVDPIPLGPIPCPDDRNRSADAPHCQPAKPRTSGLASSSLATSTHVCSTTPKTVSIPNCLVGCESYFCQSSTVTKPLKTSHFQLSGFFSEFSGTRYCNPVG